MALPTFEELWERRLNTMSADERAEFEGGRCCGSWLWRWGRRYATPEKPRG